jgi:hypothetical protein
MATAYVQSRSVAPPPSSRRQFELAYFLCRRHSSRRRRLRAHWDAFEQATERRALQDRHAHVLVAVGPGTLRLGLGDDPAVPAQEDLAH